MDLLDSISMKHGYQEMWHMVVVEDPPLDVPSQLDCVAKSTTILWFWLSGWYLSSSSRKKNSIVLSRDLFFYWSVSFFNCFFIGNIFLKSLMIPYFHLSGNLESRCFLAWDMNLHLVKRCWKFVNSNKLYKAFCVV